MTEEKKRNSAPAMTKAFLDGVGLERGVVIGTTKEGYTRTYLINPTLSDLAIYTKIIDRQILKNMGEGDQNVIRNSRANGIREVGDSKSSSK